jgi:hypothetical protein
LAVGIILLFIGVAIAPSINFHVVKASNDNNLVEVTSEACGINGFGNTTLKLTKQQYQNLEQYLIDFRARLNQTTTREEAVPIFKEAVVELNKYGLLPKGMSIEQAQKLVIGRHQNNNLMNLLRKINIENLNLINANFFCLIAGQTDFGTFFQNRITTYLWYLNEIVLGFSGIFVSLLSLFWIISIFFPLSLNQRIGFGGGDYFTPGYSPAYGWIFASGLLGAKKWNGYMSGGLRQVPLQNPFGYSDPAVCGFTGLKIFNIKNLTYLYFGTAIEIKVSLS